jgi:hypothetical protein
VSTNNEIELKKLLDWIYYPSIMPEITSRSLEVEEYCKHKEMVSVLENVLFG